MESIGGDSAGLSATDSLMRVQADAFLANMPVGLQDSQALAIRQAINGNCSALDAVRNIPAWRRMDVWKPEQLWTFLQCYGGLGSDEGAGRGLSSCTGTPFPGRS